MQIIILLLISNEEEDFLLALQTEGRTNLHFF